MTSADNGQSAQETDGPLFVDLDGTLICGDLLWDGLLLAARECPLKLPFALFGLLQGRACFKERIAAVCEIHSAELPFRQEVLELLRSERQKGRAIILATASPRRWASSIVEDVPLFDGVLATEGSVNLKGPAKLQAIQEYCRSRQFANFSYVGDSASDLVIWQQARQAFIAGPNHRLAGRLAGLPVSVAILSQPRNRWITVLRALRPHQWVKNLLVFLPIVLAHQIFNPATLLNGGIAFIAMCLCASAIYLLNDLADMHADRRHPVKKSRPIASGDLSPPPALAAAFALLLGGTAASLLALPAMATLLLIVYILATTAYTVWLKQKPIVDVLLLAGLYTLRILIGGAACNVAVSKWTLAFAIFIFLSLAFAKRYAEILRTVERGETFVRARGYQAVDLSLVETCGVTSGYLSVLVFALYIDSDSMQKLYSWDWPLWLICPLMVYWISRVWLWARRGKLLEDPVVFALTDRVSLLIGLLIAVLVFLASL